MCRNIKNLFNFDPPATDEEIYNAALQYVRKLSGFNRPSQENEASFVFAVDKIAKDTKDLIYTLKTTSPSKNREVEMERAKTRNQKRFGVKANI